MTDPLTACLAHVVPGDAPPAPPDADPLDHARTWLATRGLGLVPIADPAGFSWPGPWIGWRARDGGDPLPVVMFGVPSGVLHDPAGAGDGALVAGHLVAPLDVALWRAPAHGEPGTGVVEAILVAPAAEAPVTTLDHVRAEPGRGLEGDRYHAGAGTFRSGRPGSALTLVAAEALDDLGIEAVTARRNVVTRGVDVNALVGRRFAIGEVTCLGRRLCEPCAHLDRLAGGGVLRPLIHRGGLRADIVSAGTVAVGDEVRALRA